MLFEGQMKKLPFHIYFTYIYKVLCDYCGTIIERDYGLSRRDVTSLEQLCRILGTGTEAPVLNIENRVFY